MDEDSRYGTIPANRKQPATLDSTPLPEKSRPVHYRRQKRGWTPAIIGSILFFLVLVTMGNLAYLYFHHTSPVPKAIAKSASFPIYYPDQKKLPAGYTLNLVSFTQPKPDVVLYSVDYGHGKILVFSVQPKLSDNDLQSFYANYIPLRNHWQVVLGPAEVGAHKNSNGPLQTIVSVPVTNDNSWILITAPSDVNQDQLKQVLQSLKK